MRRYGLWSLLLFLVLLWPLTTFASRFSDLYVFGDSLSDQGNVSTITGGLIPPPEYTDGINSGRFTNGLNYVDYFSDRLGLPTSSSVLGGNNYAYGGARSFAHPLGAFGALSLNEQKDLYLGGLGMTPADADALFIVWSGSNDMSDILDQALVNPLYDPTADITIAVGGIAQVVGELAAIGAKDFLIPNVPDLGLVPLVTGGGAPVAGASFLTNLFNNALDAALLAVIAPFADVDLMRFDTFGLLNQVYADPASFGFTNAADACYSEFVLAGGATCANPDEYLSWDGFHPTSATHQILAAQMHEVVPEPTVLGLMLIGLLGVVIGRFRIAWVHS